MSLLFVLIAAGCAILLAGFYSATETAAYRASPVRLRHLAESGDPLATATLHLLGDMARLVTTTLIGHNLAVHLATFLLTRHFEDPLGFSHAEIWATACLTPICFLFGEVLPKRLAHALADRMALASTRVCRLSWLCFYPLGITLELVIRSLRRLLIRFGVRSTQPAGRTRLMEQLEAGAAEALLSESQHQMAQRILAIEALRIGEIMIPLERAVLVREDMPCREAADLIARAGLRRAPLTDRTGQPTGQKVTLNCILRNPASLDQPVTQLARPLLSLDANVSVARALHRLKADHARIALVTGKAGSPVGVVTASDLLSRVVGALRL